MSGPSTEPSQKIADQQMNVFSAQQADSKQDRTRRDELTQPAIDVNKKIASGDPGAMFAAVAPAAGEVTKGAHATRETIYDNLPAGPGRDVALAANEQGKNAQIAGMEGQAYSQSFDKLANIGSGLGSFSLQELGAGLRAGEGASNTQNTIMQADAAKKSATMGFLGSLAGAGGVAFAGRH